MAEARHRDQLASNGTPVGPLHGLPIVIKDIIDLAGQATRSGSLTRADNPPCRPVVSPVVAALRGAGAIPVAKTNTVEFALDTVGPLTNSVELAARMLAVMQRPDPADATTVGVSAKCPLRDLDRGIQGLRLARAGNEQMPHLTRQMTEAFDAALDQLRAAGARICDVEVPLPLDDYQHLGGIISATEAYATYADLVDDPTSKLAAPIRMRMARGAGISAAELIRIHRDRAQSIEQFETVIDRFDAIVLPTTPMPAPTPVAGVDETDQTMSSHTRFANYLELAALSVPMSLTENRLPTSLQIVVRRFDDLLALRIGAAFEQSRGPFSRPRLG